MVTDLVPVPPDLDHFALFGLQRRLGVDRAALDAAFLRLSREYHPDRFAAATPEVRAIAERNSARINGARRVLSDPVARAEYALELAGVERPEGEAKCPPDLLMEVFDLREKLSEEPGPELVARVGSLFADARKSLDDLFARHDAATDAPARLAVLSEIRKSLDRRKFLTSLNREVEASLGPR
jgi:molecular chaperone HscB